jgi:hypothetical protein
MKQTRFSSKILGTVLASSVMLGAMIASNARAVSVTWNGVSDFNDAQISFAPFVASQLTKVTGDGIFHDHANPGGVTVFLNIHLSGSWVNIWSFTTPDNGVSEDITLASKITSPILFASGTVDGIELTSNPDINQTYHNWNMTTLDVFTFDQVSVPDGGATMLLLGIGLVAVVCARSRKVRVA